MLPGGWLRTGDIGRMNERGYVFIESAKKDMILVSGFNVYPTRWRRSQPAPRDSRGCRGCAAPMSIQARSSDIRVRKDPSLTDAQVIDFAASRWRLTRHRGMFTSGKSCLR